jgi:hypothetical protein
MSESNPPKTIAELIALAQAAGHDALGFSVDPELRAIAEKIIAARKESAEGPFTMSKKEYEEFLGNMSNGDSSG